MSSNKCVIVVDKNLPNGLIANTACVLSLSLGKLNPEIIGKDLLDKDKTIHKGITTLPIPILASTKKDLVNLHNKLKECQSKLVIIDFSNIAQMTKNYDDYAKKLAETKYAEIEYFGIALYGDRKIVNKFTGSLGLIK